MNVCQFDFLVAIVKYYKWLVILSNLTCDSIHELGGSIPANTYSIIL